MSLTVNLNGQSRTLEGLGSQPTLAGLIALLGLKGDRIALERNGEIVSRSMWPETPLLEGDRLELVHFVGGGKQCAE